MPAGTVAKRVAAIDARVVANRPLCRAHVAIELSLAAFPPSEPGQFLQLCCADSFKTQPHVIDWPRDGFPSPDGAEWWGARAFVRRPFSIADRWDDDEGGVRLSVVSRTVGVGTRWLEHLRAGDVLNLTGPLGHGFSLPREQRPIALVGGGVGIPPLLYLARRLHEVGQRNVIAIFGATTRELLPVCLQDEPAVDATPRACAALPGEAPFPAIITTDDGSAGLRGLTTDGLEAWQRRRGRSAGHVFACGPEPMLQAVAEMTRRFGLECQLCIERRMGCGLGTCLSCVVPVHDAARPDKWRWALACTDGPVFERDVLFDYSPSPRA